MLQSKLNYYGEVVNSWVEPAKAEPIKKLSKNQKRKAKRYSEKTKTKVLGITAYQYACVETHRARFGANPELKLILAGY
jgi:putative salt-induced outer membrane protein YdiY